MHPRRLNHRLVKIHRSYTVEEIATLLVVHRNTVREWIKRGLPTVDERRPTLIQGSQLSDFLQARRQSGKRHCRPDEIYCMKCREPRRPLDNEVEYRPLTPSLGNLVGICSTCAGWMYRRASSASVAEIRAKVTVTFPKGQEHIGESFQPSVNSDFNKDAQNHEKAQPR